MDKLVLDAIAASGFQAPGTDPLLISIRKAMTTIMAQLAPRNIFGLQVRISKTVPAAAVVDSRALGKLYTSPITLARFEADSGHHEPLELQARGPRRVRHGAPGRRRPDRRLVGVMAAKKKAGSPRGKRKSRGISDYPGAALSLLARARRRR